MSGYPHNSGYGYGQPPPPQPYSSSPYGGAPPPSSAPYGAPPPPSSAPYGAPPPSSSAPYGGAPPPSSAPYGAPPPSSSKPYGAPPPSSSAPYGAPPPSSSAPYGGPSPSGSPPYGAPPPPSSSHSYGGPPPSGSPSYGGPPQGHSSYAPMASPYSAPSAPYGDPHKPPKDNYSQSYGGYPAPAPSAPYGSSPFSHSGFPPGTDPNLIACFQIADQDGSGLIDDKELQKALSSYNQSFSLRTVHLLMYLYTNSNTRKIGPKEFTAVFYSLQNWRAIFERFDRDRSGKIDSAELREALLSLGFAVSPPILELLVSKFDKTGGKNNAIEYDNFIECCLTVKGLTEKFKEKDTSFSGSATFTYESFMLTVLPFLIA